MKTRISLDIEGDINMQDFVDSEELQHKVKW